ncbi:hypothetical protein RHGRI_018404 [Rhododendron griersonianum]|uniref:Uncharacterized protein n=1 Tax=Rhododendron griersonianum TaxID=479676 RepID=A0AAV6K1A9_9ERIC|nr:hypothetical protein RHGRI_018404 [Rhododendron griersonianum]
MMTYLALLNRRIKLDGHNYLSWAPAVKIYLRGQRQISRILHLHKGRMPNITDYPPSKGDPTLPDWESIHYFVIVPFLFHFFSPSLEYWAFELLVLLAGLMPQSEISTLLLAMCVNTEAIAYMVIYGLSMAASTRVSNELGAGNPDKAKHAMVVTLMLSLVLTLSVVLALAFGHTIWAGFFSDSITTIRKYASLSHFVIISIILESITGVLSGVARGCGWQNFAVFINLGTLYCIGMPISIFLGFKHKLYTMGLWLRLICGLSCQAVGFLLLILRSKWTPMEFTEGASPKSHCSSIKTANPLSDLASLSC